MRNFSWIPLLFRGFHFGLLSGVCETAFYILVVDLLQHLWAKVRILNPWFVQVEYISPQVLGTSEIVTEPEWEVYPKMSRMEFYHGLRQRNWKSEYFNPESDPWRLQFFVDSGRLFRPSYSGYKVLITSKTGGVHWVNLPESGVENFLEDATMEREISGVPGRINNLSSPLNYGYNQVGLASCEENSITVIVNLTQNVPFTSGMLCI